MSSGETHFYHTYVREPIVEQNAFRGAPHRPQSWHAWPEFKARLPQPRWEGHADALACYWKVWELAFANRRAAQAGSGFVSDFSATAYNDCTFMWDSAFIALFGRYGRRAWDFQATLDNFYAKQHPDGFICRQIREANGTECFQRFDPAGTGPNVFAWVEWEYFRTTGDTERLARVFPALVGLHRWFRRYRTWPDGSYWATGWSGGMDNQPRLPGGYIDRETPVPGGHHTWYEHGHLTWVDACFQAILSARSVVRIAALLGRESEVADLAAEADALTAWCNAHLWNERTGWYHDRRRDGTLSEIETIGAFWAVLAEAAPAERCERMLAALADPQRFARTHRVASLSAASEGFLPNGGYWRGGVWPPTNYLVLRALGGRDGEAARALAHDIGVNHHANVVEAFRQTGTLWENYAPDFFGMGRAAKDFVGWSGLPPVAVLFENVFGWQCDWPARRLTCDVRRLEAHGVERYPLGADGELSLHFAARNESTAAPSFTLRASEAFELEVHWAGGSRRWAVAPGTELRA